MEKILGVCVLMERWTAFVDKREESIKNKIKIKSFQRSTGMREGEFGALQKFWIKTLDNLFEF